MQLFQQVLVREVGSSLWRPCSGIFLACLLSLGGSLGGCSSPEAYRPSINYLVDYNFHVRPILSNNCYNCHGPDPSSREAGLRLDTEAGAKALNEEGQAAVVPGNPASSLLMQRITAHGTDDLMPPPESKKTLGEHEIALLEAWIEQGAHWKPHWAFIPPETETSADLAPSEAIDAYLEASLREQGLSPAPEAPPASLLRRLSFVLTGLPPSPEAVRAFEAQPETYEAWVDHYLASPHFGEQWARHWMDLTRYAETKGHEFDYAIGGAWRYRDYLIRAFNQDLPYDQLIHEHLAGDQLARPRWNPETGFNESVLGTAFYYMSEGKHSPVDTRKEESDVIDNIIDVTSKTFQGLTLACARCHDHKFDPLPTKDYYALYGVFESARFTPFPAESSRETRLSLQEVAAIKQSLRQQMAARWPGASEQRISPSEQVVHRTANTSPPSHATKVLGDFRSGQWEGWFSDGFAFGPQPVMGAPLWNGDRTHLLGLDEGKASGKTYGTGLQGALRSPNFTIEQPYLTLRARGRASCIRVVMDNFQLIRYPIYGGLEQKVEDESWKDYVFDLGMWKGHKAYVEVMVGQYDNHQYVLSPDAYVEVRYAFHHDAPGAAAPARQSLPATLPDVSESLAAWTEGDCRPAHLATLNQALQASLPIPEAVRMSLDTLRSLASRLHDPTYIMGLTEGEAIQSHVFLRGDHNKLSDEPVKRVLFRAIETINQPLPTQGSGRLGLAEALTSPQNPLTARVMVNRLWHHLFGRGIVETVDNFGIQGKLPTHPDLLDYLAVTFVREGWSVKRMIKHMVMSEAFRRSTQAPADAQARDPENHYLSHYPLRRLPAEAIRDAMLSVSGCLDPQLYGPSVPIHLTNFMKGRGRPYRSGPLDGAGRRSIYTEIRRNFLPPMMLVFDMPAPFSTFGRRNASNVPAQSLTLMNDPFVLDQAHMWARRALDLYSSDRQRISALYLAAFARQPTDDELEAGLLFLDEQTAIYQRSDQQEGEAESSEGVLPLQVRVWRDYCHSLFNMKAFIYLL